MASKQPKWLAALGWQGILLILGCIVLGFAGAGWLMIAKGIQDGSEQAFESWASRPWWANLPLVGWFWTAEDEVMVQGGGDV